MPLGREIGLGRGDIFLTGDPVPPPKKRRTAVPTFGPRSIVAKRLDGSRCHWYGDRPQPRPHCVRWAFSSPRKGHSSSLPLFGPCPLWPNSWADQDAIRTEIGLSTGHIVLDRDPAPFPNGAPQPLPTFRPMAIAPNGLMGEDSRCHLVRR